MLKNEMMPIANTHYFQAVELFWLPRQDYLSPAALIKIC